MGKTYFMIEQSWKRECLSLWSFGIHRHTVKVVFPSLMRRSLFYKLRWLDFENKNYKDWKLFNLTAESCHSASEFLSWSETLNFNDNIQNLEDVFCPFCFSFLFWKCRDTLAGLVSPWCYVILWHQHRYIQLWHMILSGMRKKGRRLSLWAGHDS